QQPQGYKAFVPAKFPPSDNFLIPSSLMAKHTEAIRLLGKLDGVTQLLPDRDMFLLMFIKKDAASSSQIEGTQATIADAIEAGNREPRGSLPQDVDDIIHYISALDYGLKRAEEFPFSLRFIRELHKTLMRDARATQFCYPGEFRKTQNWIGGTRPSNALFVPPPVDEMMQALSDLERFVYDNEQYPILIKAGLLHAQFETIHPFTDGNGRTGRMLITMFLWAQKLLELPVLYLSSYFRQHQDFYYERLNGYHRGQVFEWLDFFLEGIILTAESSIETCIKITELRERDMRKVQSLGKTSAESTMKILTNLFSMPIAGIADIMEWTGFTAPGGYKAIERLVEMDILKPMAHQTSTYAKKWVYKDYLDLFTGESEADQRI
ncbi:MAG: Fic family protein, partial [Raoultibacter sp.]